MLDGHRLAVGGAHALEAEHRRARRKRERAREEAVRLDQRLRAHERARHEAASAHVLAERAERHRLRDARLGDERPAPVDAVDESLGGEPVELAAHGHARQLEALGQLALGGQRRAGRQRLDQPAEDRAQLAALGAVAEAGGQPARAHCTPCSLHAAA